MNQDGPYAADQHLTYNKLKVDELSRNVFDNPEFR